MEDFEEPRNGDDAVSGSPILAQALGASAPANITFLELTQKEAQKQEYSENMHGPGCPFEVITVRQILIRHRGSRSGERINRTPEEALHLIELYKEQLVADDTSFAKLASKVSECYFAQPGEAFILQRGAEPSLFEVSAFALRAGEISGIVETEAGYHIILRID